MQPREKEVEKGSTAEQYLDYATQLEHHPNFEARKEMVPVGGEVRLRQYVAYCHERAEENYTNELPEKAEARFRKFFNLLEKTN